jgi:archaemetzincin
MITLVPVGEIPIETLTFLLEELPGRLSRPAELAKPILISASFSTHRRQYLGDAILHELKRQPHNGKIVGLVEADCYAPGLNFIFGQAVLNGDEAFVALPRLHEAFYDRREDDQLFHQRVLKEVLHELGHTFGLGHCSDPLCVMHFSNSLQDTDQKQPQFCQACRKNI